MVFLEWHLTPTLLTHIIFTLLIPMSKILRKKYSTQNQNHSVHIQSIYQQY